MPPSDHRISPIVFVFLGCHFGVNSWWHWASHLNQGNTIDKWWFEYTYWDRGVLRRFILYFAQSPLFFTPVEGWFGGSLAHQMGLVILFVLTFVTSTHSLTQIPSSSFPTPLPSLLSSSLPLVSMEDSLNYSL